MEFIEKEALIKWLISETGFKTNCDDCTDIDCVDCIVEYAIKTAPTFERESGYWIGKPIAGYGTVKCSCCGTNYNGNSGKWTFCPTCGAIMDSKKEKKDEEVEQ